MPSTSSIKPYRSRHNYTLQHIAAAEDFASQVARIEQTSPPSKDCFAPLEYYHQWRAAVVFSAMSLDAYKYELLTAPLRDDPTPLTEKLPESKAAKIPLMEGYERVWRAARPEKQFWLGEGVIEDAKALLNLRHQLVHAKTEWRDEAAISNELAAELRNKFGLNPFACGRIFFPDECTSADSARWAVAAARQFVLRFAEELAVRSPL